MTNEERRKERVTYWANPPAPKLLWPIHDDEGYNFQANGKWYTMRAKDVALIRKQLSRWPKDEDVLQYAFLCGFEAQQHGRFIHVQARSTSKVDDRAPHLRPGDLEQTVGTGPQVHRGTTHRKDVT